MAKSKPDPKPKAAATPAAAVKPAAKAAPAAAAKPAPAAAKAAPAAAKAAPAAKGKAAPPPPKPAPKPLTKTGIYQALAEKTELDRKQVEKVFNALLELIKEQVGPGGPGVMKLPGLIKLTRVEKPEVPAGEYLDKFSKTMKHREARPARVEIKPRALKELKELVGK